MNDPIYGVLTESLERFRKNNEENRIIIESITTEEDDIVQSITGDLEVGTDDNELDALLDKIPVTSNKEAKITTKDLDDVSKDANPTIEELAEGLVDEYLLKTLK